MNRLALAALLSAFILACIVPIATSHHCQCEEYPNDCEYPYKAEGCFAKGSGMVVKLNPDNGEGCCDRLCKCSIAAHNAGYQYFGIANLKECWGGNAPPGTAVSSGDCCDCYNWNAWCKPPYKYCVGSPPRLHHGRRYFFVYKIASCHCWKHFRKMNCRKDFPKPNRVLEHLTCTGRDPSSPVYQAPRINWACYHIWLPKFICKCASLALQKGHRYFGIEFWGECWSDTFPKRGELSDNCYNQCFHKCKDTDRFCTGAVWALQVYRFNRIWFKNNQGTSCD